MTALNTLFRASQNHNLTLKDRKTIVSELKEQWPQTFKNISDETIITGKAADAYKNLKDQILAAAYAEAYKNKITGNASRSIDNEQRLVDENANNLKLENQKNAIQTKIDNTLHGIDKKNAVEKRMGDRDYRKYASEIDVVNEKLTASNKVISNLKTDTDLLNKENKKYTDGIDKLTEKFGASVLIHKNETQASNQKRYRKNNPNTTHGEDLMAAQSNTITQHFENEKKAYDNELALLNDQLNKKLISQAEYNKKSRELEEQYHQGIGSSIKDFAESHMDATVKQLKDVAEAEGKLNYDETNVKKAILPGQKLDAEKQLITDKYNYEITLANGNAEKIKELETKKQQELSTLTQQYEQQRKEFALNTAQQVADKAFSIIGNNIKASSDAKIKGLEKDKAGELSNKNLTETQRKAIEDKYNKKEDQEKLKAFKAEQRMSVLQAVVNGALAVTKATAQTGVLAPFVIPGIIASTALQIATIVAQKPPAFAKGGMFMSDGRGALLPGYSRTDNTNAFLRSGEAVVVSEAMRNPWARNLVSAINVAHGGRDFSMPHTGRGYAIGGIFTDGGNANRYYNQPVNDMKDMANTLAYQMINNFPPIYVDVKDVNNQQNILAQTVNRVNL